MDPTTPTPWAPALALVAGLLLVACDGEPAPVDDTDAVATGSASGGAPDGYPAGPYGADVGEVLPNLAWKGFVDDDGLGLATEGDYVDLDLATVRQGGARWALVHFGTVF